MASTAFTLEDALARLAGGMPPEPDMAPLGPPPMGMPAPQAFAPPQAAQAPLQHGGVPWGEILKSAMPLIMAGVAAKQGGRGAAGAMLQGMAVAGEARRRSDIAALEQQNQATNDELARQENYRRYAQGQAEKGAAFYRETVKALSELSDPAQLASATEAAERVGQSVYGFHPGMFTSLQLAPKSTQDADAKAARDLIAALEKEHGDNFKTLPEGTLVTFKGKQTTLKDLRALAQLSLTSPEGQAVVVPPVPKVAPTTEDERTLKEIVFPTYAEKIGKTVDTLTAADRKAAILQWEKELSAAGRNPQGGGLFGNQGPQSDIDEIANEIIEGRQPPVMTGLYGKTAAVRAALGRKDYDLSRAQQDWQATTRHLATLNGAQQTRLRQAVSFAADSLDVIDDLSAKWQAGRFPILNKGRLELAIQGGLGPDAQSLATQLKAQIADLTSELGTVYKGGNSSTDESLKLAATNLSANWSEKQLKDAVALVRKNLKIRQNSLQTTGVAGTPGNPYAREEAPQGFAVTAPDGKVYTFPTQKALDDFKKAAGIK